MGFFYGGEESTAGLSEKLQLQEFGRLDWATKCKEGTWSMDAARRGESLDGQSDEAVGSGIVGDVDCGARDSISKDHRFLSPGGKVTVTVS